jgi:serine/threonine protein kinase
MEENLGTFIDIFVQIWDGVKSLHAQGLVHSDLKPANVFLHRNGRTGPLIAKVGDFGVANWLPDGGQSILVGGAGTVPYMAPERLKHDKFGKRSDIWALGCILYEMLYKRLAYNRKEDILSESYQPS